jgi:hypothetical protein
VRSFQPDCRLACYYPVHSGFRCENASCYGDPTYRSVRTQKNCRFHWTCRRSGQIRSFHCCRSAWQSLTRCPGPGSRRRRCCRTRRFHFHSESGRTGRTLYYLTRFLNSVQQPTFHRAGQLLAITSCSLTASVLSSLAAVARTASISVLALYRGVYPENLVKPKMRKGTKMSTPARKTGVPAQLVAHGRFSACPTRR